MLRRLIENQSVNTIYLPIAGTYTPIVLKAVRGTMGWVIFGVVWAAAIFGIVITSIDLERFRKLSIVCYVVMGWGIVAAAKPLLNNMTTPSLWLLLIGGLLYTIGIFFYVNKSKKYYHTVWHLFTLAGSAFHYFSILLMFTN